MNMRRYEPKPRSPGHLVCWVIALVVARGFLGPIIEIVLIVIVGFAAGLIVTVVLRVVWRRDDRW